MERLPPPPAAVPAVAVALGATTDPQTTYVALAGSSPTVRPATAASSAATAPSVIAAQTIPSKPPLTPAHSGSRSASSSDSVRDGHPASAHSSRARSGETGAVSNDPAAPPSSAAPDVKVEPEAPALNIEDVHASHYLARKRSLDVLYSNLHERFWPQVMQEIDRIDPLSEDFFDQAIPMSLTQTFIADEASALNTTISVDSSAPCALSKAMEIFVLELTLCAIFSRGTMPTNDWTLKADDVLEAIRSSESYDLLQDHANGIERDRRAKASKADKEKRVADSGGAR